MSSAAALHSNSTLFSGNRQKGARFLLGLQPLRKIDDRLESCLPRCALGKDRPANQIRTSANQIRTSGNQIRSDVRHLQRTSLPLRSSRRCDARRRRTLSGRRTGRGPRHSRASCGRGTASLVSRGSAQTEGTVKQLVCASDAKDTTLAGEI